MSKFVDWYVQIVNSSNLEIIRQSGNQIIEVGDGWRDSIERTKTRIGTREIRRFRRFRTYVLQESEVSFRESSKAGPVSARKVR